MFRPDCISNFRIFGLNSDIGPTVSLRPNGNNNSSSKDQAGFFLDMYCCRLSFIPITQSLQPQSEFSKASSQIAHSYGGQRGTLLKQGTMSLFRHNICDLEQNVYGKSMSRKTFLPVI
jgi:hypothetical protein